MVTLASADKVIWALRTQKNLSEILLNRTEIRLYLPFPDWFGTKRTLSVWCQINEKMVNTIWFWFNLIRIWNDFSVCSFSSAASGDNGSGKMNCFSGKKKTMSYLPRRTHRNGTLLRNMFPVRRYRRADLVVVFLRGVFSPGPQWQSRISGIFFYISGIPGILRIYLKLFLSYIFSWDTRGANAYTCKINYSQQMLVIYTSQYSASDWKSNPKNEWVYSYIFIVNLGLISLNI